MRIEALAQHILQSVGDGAQLVPHVLLVRVARVSDRLLFERWKKCVSPSAYTWGYARHAMCVPSRRHAGRPSRADARLGLSPPPRSPEAPQYGGGSWCESLPACRPGSEEGRKGTEADESRGWAGSEARRCSHGASSAPAAACEEKARRQGASKRKPPRAGLANPREEELRQPPHAPLISSY